MFDHIEWEPDSYVLEYGAGGGLLTNYVLETVPSVNVCMVDISSKSINECLEYVGKDKIFHYQEIPNDLDDFNWTGPEIHTIYCNEVIQHFPSIEYFREVVNLWKNKIKARQIAFQVKLAPVTRSCNNYETEFLNGLLLSERDCINFFKHNYELKHFSQIKSLHDQYLGYFVWQLKI